MVSQRELLDLRRKLVHVTLGSFFVVLITNPMFSQREDFILLLVVILVIGLSLSYYIKRTRNKLLTSILRLFDKPKDLVNFPGKGAIYYIVGMLIAVLMFERDVAAASIAILAVGDPAAFFIGRYYGSTKLVVNSKKLLEGTIAGIIAGTIFASIFVQMHIAFFGAMFGMIAESFEIDKFHLDDNFFIPFISGIIMTMLLSL